MAASPPKKVGTSPKTSKKIPIDLPPPTDEPFIQETPSSPLDFLTDFEKIEYNKLWDKTFLETRSVSDHYLLTMGIKDKIDEFLNNLSWGAFMKPKYPGYKNLTT